jgi:hypothetical protein
VAGEPGGADRGEILGEHLFPNLRERKFAQRAPSAARTSTVVATTYDHKEVTVKTQTRMASLSLLAILCLGLAAAPARAGILYDNGPITALSIARTSSTARGMPYPTHSFSR